MKTVEEAKADFLQIVADLGGPADVECFMTWLKTKAFDEIMDNHEREDKQEYLTRMERRRVLKQVSTFSKSLQPRFEATFPSENIMAPQNSEEGLNFQSTASVDAFLYDEVDVEELTQEGKVPTHYCKKCGTRDGIFEIELITHSAGRDDLEFIFDALLPDLTGQSILDIGSRIGAVLFGAYVYANNSFICGIEMNPDVCQVAMKTIENFQMQDRVQIVNAELSTRADLVQAANVIVLNNVFDWFVPMDVQVKLWQFIRQNTQSGTLMVTIPSIEESLRKLPNSAGIDLYQWVKPSPPFRPTRLPSHEIEEKSELIKLYQVL